MIFDFVCFGFYFIYMFTLISIYIPLINWCTCLIYPKKLNSIIVLLSISLYLIFYDLSVNFILYSEHLLRYSMLVLLHIFNKDTSMWTNLSGKLVLSHYCQNTLKLSVNYRIMFYIHIEHR